MRWGRGSSSTLEARAERLNVRATTRQPTSPPATASCLHYLLTCGDCAFCRRGAEQFCPQAQMIGKDRDGGFAEYIVVPARNAIPVPDGIPARARGGDDVLLGHGLARAGQGPRAAGRVRGGLRRRRAGGVGGAAGESLRRGDGLRRRSPCRRSWRWPSDWGRCLSRWEGQTRGRGEEVRAGADVEAGADPLATLADLTDGNAGGSTTANPKRSPASARSRMACMQFTLRTSMRSATPLSLRFLRCGRKRLGFVPNRSRARPRRPRRAIQTNRCRQRRRARAPPLHAGLPFGDWLPDLGMSRSCAHVRRRPGSARDLPAPRSTRANFRVPIRRAGRGLPTYGPPHRIGPRWREVRRADTPARLRA